MSLGRGAVTVEPTLISSHAEMVPGDLGVVYFRDGFTPFSWITPEGVFRWWGNRWVGVLDEPDIGLPEPEDTRMWRLS